MKSRKCRDTLKSTSADIYIKIPLDAASSDVDTHRTIGNNFKMGGLSVVLGHLEICDDVSVGAHTLITKSIKSPGNYIGIMPAQHYSNWSKSAVFIKKRGK